MSDYTAIDIQFDPREQRMRGVAAHGNTRFDVPFISEIDENLWQGGTQDGLIMPTFIRHEVSLYPWEHYTAIHELDTSLEVRMYDSADQEFDQLQAIAAWVTVCRKTGPVLIRCQAGLNRSSLVTATVLMLAGRTATESIALIREKRSPACLCNKAFEKYLLEK